MKPSKIFSLIIILAILLVAGFVWYKSNRTNLQRLVQPVTPTTVSETTNVKGWESVTPVTPQIYKMVKIGTTGFQPTIIVLKNEITIPDPKNYTDNLIKGARSVLPSLVFTSDTTSTQDNFFTRSLDGYYYSKKTKIFVMQELIIKNNQLLTIAGSSTGNDLNQAFAFVVSQQLKSW